eukprot:scaffold1444_cov134-Isochrysis_galbana.AAC.9
MSCWGVLRPPTEYQGLLRVPGMYPSNMYDTQSNTTASQAPQGPYVRVHQTLKKNSAGSYCLTVDSPISISAAMNRTNATRQVSWAG